MIITIILVILIFSSLVIAHEFGHFITARRNGVQVDEFGIGFPPKLWGKQKGKTLYTINALPIGGFVRLKGEQGESDAPDSFAAQRPWVKSKILLAGVTMNLLIAYVIITGLLMTGVPPIMPGALPSIGPIKPTSSAATLMVVGVERDSVAARLGIKNGDKIVTIQGDSVATPEALKAKIDSLAGQEAKLVVREKGKTQVYTVALPKKTAGKALLGVSTVAERLQRYPWYYAPIVAVVVIFQMIVATLAAFGGLIIGLFTKAQVAETVTGPIGITVIFSEVFKYGWSYVFGLIASISLSLAIINSLPLPALDGGRLLIVVLQKIGINVSEGTEALVHTIGFALLMILMVAVSAADIMRLI